jgi:hypothetical protein
MKRKVEQQPIAVLLDLILVKVTVLKMNLGYPNARNKRDMELQAISHLGKILDAPEVTLGLGISMTALTMNSTWEDVDKPDPIVMRYAIEFAVENRNLIAEVILTDGKGEGYQPWS